MAAPFLLAAGLLLAQPDPRSVDFGSFVGLAALVGTTVSLAVTVTLLVAQHMAERHARELYREFRRDRVWSVTLAALGLGVLFILGVGIAVPTHSSAAAALLVTAGLGIAGGAALPHILDTFDRVVLVERVADRIVGRIVKTPTDWAPWQRDGSIRAEIEGGVATLCGIATEAVADEDEQVLRAAISGVRRILLSGMRAVNFIQISDPSVAAAFQRLNVLTDACIRRSPVLLLPVLVDELTALGIEGARFPNPLNDAYEPISTPLTDTLQTIAIETSSNDLSAAASMATHALGEVSLALVAATRANASISEIQVLHSIGVASLDNGRDHITRQALYELTRIGTALPAIESDDIMISSAYEATSRSLADLLQRFRVRQPRPTLADLTLTGVIGPLSDPNLSTVVLGGAEADTKKGHSDDFGFGAEDVTSALMELFRAGPKLPLTSGNVMTACYSIVVGGLALYQTARIDPERAMRWWWGLVDSAIDLEVAGTLPFHGLDALSMLLVLSVCVVSQPDAALHIEWLERRVEEAAKKSAAVPDEKTRRRLASTWEPACGAAIALHAPMLADSFLSALRPTFESLRALRAARPYADHRLFLPAMVLPRTPIPGCSYPVDVASAFTALDSHLGGGTAD